MARTYKLVLDFLTAAEKTTRFTYNYADANNEASDVTTLMNAIITNGSIFKNVPVTKKAAKLVATEETAYNIA